MVFGLKAVILTIFAFEQSIFLEEIPSKENFVCPKKLSSLHMWACVMLHTF